MLVVAGQVKGLAEVAAQHGALRFHGSGHFEVAQPARPVAPADPAQPASEPRVAQSPVQRDGVLEERLRLVEALAGAEEKTVQRQRLGVAGAECQAPIESLQRRPGAGEAKLQFRHAHPRQGEPRRSRHGLPGGMHGAVQIMAALLVIGLCQPLRREPIGCRGRGLRAWFALDRGDHETDRCRQSRGGRVRGSGRQRSDRVEEQLGLGDIPNGEQQRGEKHGFFRRSRLAAGRVVGQRLQQVPLAIRAEGFRQRAHGLVGQREFVRVQDAGIGGAPLHHVHDIDDGR